MEAEQKFGQGVYQWHPRVPDWSYARFGGHTDALDAGYFLLHWSGSRQHLGVWIVRHRLPDGSIASRTRAHLGDAFKYIEHAVGFGEVPSASSKARCVCDIRNLMTYGHDLPCPERKQ